MILTTTMVKNWMKSVVTTQSITMGKLDRTKEQTVCVYGSRSSSPARLFPASYDDKTVQVIVRWTHDSELAETKAAEVYGQIANQAFQVQGKAARSIPVYDEPISLGTDEKGVYEYSIDLTIYCER